MALKDKYKEKASRKERAYQTKLPADKFITTDHDEIRAWIELREGRPVTVKSSLRRGEKAGIIRVLYEDEKRPEQYVDISWEDFFAKFEAEKLAFLCSMVERFSRFIRREGIDKK